MPWGEDDKQSTHGSLEVPTKVPQPPKPSSFTESISRVEGSGQAILKMLRRHLRKQPSIDEEGEEEGEGELVLVKTGAGTVVSSNLTSPKPGAPSIKDQPGKSVFDEINAGERVRRGFYGILEPISETSVHNVAATYSSAVSNASSTCHSRGRDQRRSGCHQA